MLTLGGELWLALGMSNCHCDHPIAGLPPEDRLLDEILVRLITPDERQRFDLLMEREHYLCNATAVGQVLHYVALYRGQWVGLLTFCSAALHLKFREHLLGWNSRQLCERRHLIAQNSRFLILPSTGRWPNLASRVLKLTCDRLSEDWKERAASGVRSLGRVAGMRTRSGDGSNLVL